MTNTLYEVFTPSSPARLTFVERDAVNEKLVSALRTPGKQVVVYGHSGSGKTTLLLNKLHQTYEGHVTSRCLTGSSLDSLVLDAFDQLAPFYEAERKKGEGSSVDVGLSADYAGIRSSLAVSASSSASETAHRVLPPQLTPQRLGQFMGASKMCWVLEDFHKVDDDDKVRLAQVMKVFMDLSDTYPELKIVAIGAVDTARQVVESDGEMRNRVAEVHVPLMSTSELMQIIDKGKACLNFQLPQAVADDIVRYSNGLASVCHQICLNICDAAGIVETQPESVDIQDDDLDTALRRYIEDASDTLKAVFDRALRRIRSRKYDNARLILAAVAELSHDGATHADIFAKIRRTEPDYPSGNLTTYLKELQAEERGAVIRCDASGRFAFSDPMYQVFAKATLCERPSRDATGAGSAFGWTVENAFRGIRVGSVDLDSGFEAWYKSLATKWATVVVHYKAEPETPDDAPETTDSAGAPPAPESPDQPGN